MGAGGCQSELEMLLSRVAADLTTLRELIDTLASDDARALLLAPLLRVRSRECAFGLMVGLEEPWPTTMSSPAIRSLMTATHRCLPGHF